MRSIVHHALGLPSEVLRMADLLKPTDIPVDAVVVRTALAPIHPGDLLGVAGSPAFGRPVVPPRGRIPGFEGSGVIAELGAEVSGWRKGQRVAYFPAAETWSDYAVVPASSLVALPTMVSDEVGAQILINYATALVLIADGHEAVPPDKRHDAVVIVTAAGSAVGRIVATLLWEAGVTPIRLVRSEESEQTLRRLNPEVPAISTSDPRWRDRTTEASGGRDIYVALDAVGGDLLGAVGELMVRGGTILNYGSLGGERSDLRSIVPNRLSIRGISIGQWIDRDPVVRAEERSMAVAFAGRHPELFEVAGIYPPDRINDAVAHMDRPGRAGTVMLGFSNSEAKGVTG